MLAGYVVLGFTIATTLTTGLYALHAGFTAHHKPIARHRKGI